MVGARRRAASSWRPGTEPGLARRPSAASAESYSEKRPRPSPTRSLPKALDATMKPSPPAARDASTNDFKYRSPAALEE